LDKFWQKTLQPTLQ